MNNPLKFQLDIIDKLTNVFIELWKQPGRQLPMVFKSPTGSGKTFMVAYFMRGLNKLPNWDQDKSFIWITFSDDLAMQSKRKFEEYFDNTLENGLLTVNDINRGKLYKNDILFLNWQKVVSKAAENRVLRKPEEENMRKESGKYFEDFIDGTHKDEREIILIIDEAHTHVTPDLAQHIVDYINPKIVVHITATPDPVIIAKAAELNSFIQVKREDVVEAGLIKEKIITQTNEDLIKFKNKDFDEILLNLGLEKRDQLKKEFKILGKNINPLLLIQLPNDDREKVSAGEDTKEQIVTRFLLKKGISENKIARWFDNHPKPDGLEDNEDNNDILIFKLAAGTGWDCPRAHVLVMFRETNVEKRYIQTVGRILRMPEPHSKDDYKNNPNLRTGYLYTNYNRDDISNNWIDKSQNKPLIYLTRRKEGIENIQIQSDYVSRIEYGDLSNSAAFQSNFIKSMNSYFEIEKTDILGKAQKKLEKRGINLSTTLQNKIIVNAKFEDYDHIDFDFKKQGEDLDVEMSQNDVEKTFNYLCFQVLKEQTEENAKIANIARSWGPLKSALRVWAKDIINEYELFYRIFIKDIRKGAGSVFKPAITQAIKNYKPELQKIIEARRKKIEQTEGSVFTILEEYGYTEDCEEIKCNLYALEKCYFLKDYIGKINEANFRNYIDSKKGKIEWWFKNGDVGQEYLGIKYFNMIEQANRLFYPDWIIRFKDGRIGIFDTKSGDTALSQNTADKAKALAEKIKNISKKYIGGIVVFENGVWYYNDSPNYSYTSKKLNKDWKLFEDLF